MDNPSQTSKVNDASVSKDGLSYSYNDVLEQRKDVLEQRRDVLEQRKNVSVKRLGSLKKINVGIEVC